ncbi:hypothetical protein SE18_11210 [Herpetosiphon geysericola]|uniref:Uncharacterized protein n=1 Tax=Herpetosiphon geysericola TaxID=70996 RepID=A0A0P6YP67_9CHLR|nr:hypothetical protein SE18_11210 [Herpetosiphon geysericola]
MNYEGYRAAEPESKKSVLICSEKLSLRDLRVLRGSTPSWIKFRGCLAPSSRQLTPQQKQGRLQVTLQPPLTIKDYG